MVCLFSLLIIHVFVCRFVNKKGEVLERLLGVQHVVDTTSANLKRSLDAMFVKHDLSMSRLRGQGYDGASNMRGELHGLSQALQQKDQNIVSAMNMVVSVKSLLQKLRDDGWEPLLLASTNFCGGRNIIVPNMDDNISALGYPRSSRKMVTCLHHYKVQIFNEVVDRNIVEMNNRFCETSTRLLRCVACLDPRDSFSRFDHEKLVELAKMYIVDFSSHDCYLLIDELSIYIDVMKRSIDFLGCDSLTDLALKLVQTRQHLIFPLVYRLITLALTLPVATASVERVFSAMNIIKSDLRNKIGDDWLNDLMICYVEKEIFAKIDDKRVMLRFHSFKNR